MKKNLNKYIYDKILGSLTKKGKKNNAKRILDSSFVIASDSLGISSFIVCRNIFSKLNCNISVKHLKIRKRDFVVPFPLNSNRQDFMKTKWLISSLKESNSKTSLYNKLSSEMINILLGKGSISLKKRALNNKEVLKNRSNTHYR